MEAFGCAQVTMNLHNHRVTGLHTAFEAVSAEAAGLGLRVTGSELVGLAPLQAVLDAGEHFLRKQRKNVGIPETAVVHAAVHSLGLNEISPFNAEERIVEYSLRGKRKRLVDVPVLRFVDDLSSESPAPGGGSASALSGALSAALCSMVANLTFGRREILRYNPLMEEVSVEAQKLKTKFIELVDRDTDAFNAYMAATRMPKKTEEENRNRDLAVTAAAHQTTLVPFETLELIPAVLVLAETVARKGNAGAVSDAAVAAIQAEAAAEGAWMNVLINLPMVNDPPFADDIRNKSKAIIERVRQMKKRNLRIAQRRLAK
jgi:glutamate formiminotransferase/formiminotetrahydrofolate cyclodeaminase